MTSHVLSNSKILHVFLDSWPLEVIRKVYIKKVETSYFFKTSEKLKEHSDHVSVVLLELNQKLPGRWGLHMTARSKVYLSKVHIDSSGNFLDCHENWNG